MRALLRASLLATLLFASVSAQEVLDGAQVLDALYPGVDSTFASEAPPSELVAEGTKSGPENPFTPSAPTDEGDKLPDFKSFKLKPSPAPNATETKLHQNMFTTRQAFESLPGYAFQVKTIEGVEEGLLAVMKAMDYAILKNGSVPDDDRFPEAPPLDGSRGRVSMTYSLWFKIIRVRFLV